MKISVISANLGNFDKPVPYIKQSVDYDFHLFTDENFPPRFNSMTPRLQARIPKMFGWQLRPGYDIYIWVDSSMTLQHKDSVKWFIDQLGDADMAVFKHPHRKTVLEEADYLWQRIADKDKYILPRYENEDIDGQLDAVDPKAQLFASTAFIYRNKIEVSAALKEWWHHTSRYHSIDQLSFPYAIQYLDINVIPDKYWKTPYLTPTR